MSTTITALFDNRSDAENAKERLQAAQVSADHIYIQDQSSPGYSATGYSSHQERGIWESIKNAFLPDEDRHTYEEGVRRGGVLLTADVDEASADAAMRVLDNANSVDIDDRADQWRQSGWDYSPGTAAAGLSAAGIAATQTSATQATDSYRTADTGTVGEREEVIPVVEEQLVVGKRDVSRGGVRVRSYVSEVPVQEQVRLRNEQINVERRAVDQPLSAADADAFRERTIDVTATGEEAVVQKNARVVEEVVVSKTAEEHVENIEDTVRHTDVEVERDDAGQQRDPALRTDANRAL